MSRSIYYHGGPAGLGRIEPASVTGVKNAEDLCPDLDTAHVRRDRVFLTTDYLAAVMFAAAHRKPMVYVVTPDDTPEPDPDWLGEDGVSVQSSGASIVRCIKPKPYEVRMCRAVVLERAK